MSVRTQHGNEPTLYYITYTCYNWLHLFSIANAYDLIYKWFDYLKDSSVSPGSPQRQCVRGGPRLIQSRTVEFTAEVDYIYSCLFVHNMVMSQLYTTSHILAITGFIYFLLPMLMTLFTNGLII